ncbi:MAG TPA: dethiobiotin synthase [Longimicrobiaceae bacterium]|nr:dethiobiotin synthase [Longimicrobiaceae bacterium]
MIGLGVTGTDTGVGKTVISTALLALLHRRSLRVAGMKPVETGVAVGDPESDAARLRAAAGGTDPMDDVCPIVLPEPLAPWVAARRANTRVDLERLDRAFVRLCGDRDVVVVEGAGGLLVPLTRVVAFDDLFRRWKLEVVVVAGNRLGVLNHALLTVRAARASGLPVRGVVLNQLSTACPGTAERTNRDALVELLPDVPVVTFPWVSDPRDHDRLVSAAEASGLAELLPAVSGPPPGTVGQPGG